jgi:hypothetical protein
MLPELLLWPAEAVAHWTAAISQKQISDHELSSALNRHEKAGNTMKKQMLQSITARST